MTDLARWWGDTTLAVGERARWRIGPLTLWVRREAHEWVVAWLRAPDPTERTLEIAARDAGEPTPDAEVRRLAGGRSDLPLQLGVRLPDRPFVARPETALTLVAGGELTIHLSLPVTVALAQGAPLIELLSSRPSDTWLGATPRAGQLAYFTRTRALTDLSAFVPSPGRVQCALQLRNHTTSAVPVPRVSVPAQQLGVYADEGHRLYTEDLTVDFRNSPLGITPEVHLASVRDALVRVGAPRILPDRLRLSDVVRGIFE